MNVFQQARKIEQAQRYAEIISIMYGIVQSYEISKSPITHDTLKQKICHEANCSQQELSDAMDELVRYAEIVKRLKLP